MKERPAIKRVGWILALGACVPVVYVLSIGPAAFVYDNFDFVKRSSFGNTLGLFYSPMLDYMKDSDDYPAKLLHWYVDLWIDAD